MAITAALNSAAAMTVLIGALLASVLLALAPGVLAADMPSKGPM
jgi:hypothetical protein